MYRSSLEKKFGEFLETHKVPFLYEKRKFVLQEKFDHSINLFVEERPQSKKIRAITYTPDFIGDKWIVEIKGHRKETFNIKWKMFLRHISSQQEFKDYKVFIIKNTKQFKHFLSEINNN